jgi:hypothetical protein
MVKRDAVDLIEMRACLHTLRQITNPDKYRDDLAKMGLTEEQANYLLSEDPKAFEAFEKWLWRRRGQMRRSTRHDRETKNSSSPLPPNEGCPLRYIAMAFQVPTPLNKMAEGSTCGRPFMRRPGRRTPPAKVGRSASKI